MQLSEEMVAEKKIYLFSHTNVVGCREDPFGVNLGGLCYESIKVLIFALEILFGFALSDCI